MSLVMTDVKNIIKKTWLENPVFEFQQAIELLSKNDFIKEYLEIRKQKELNDLNFEPYIDKYKSLLAGTTNQLFLNYPKAKVDLIINIDKE